jgi:hypothetical protein
MTSDDLTRAVAAALADTARPYWRRVEAGVIVGRVGNLRLSEGDLAGTLMVYGDGPGAPVAALRFWEIVRVEPFDRRRD